MVDSHNVQRPSWFPYVIHPLLDNKSRSLDISFDLSASTFSPLRYTGGRKIPISAEDLEEAATYPTITRLRVVCDTIHQWPIEITHDKSHKPSTIPISLGDILLHLHRALHQYIYRKDLMELDGRQEAKIARAYTRRCNNVSSIAPGEVRQGVKRVDYLSSKVHFKGMVKLQAENGWEIWKLNVH